MVAVEASSTIGGKQCFDGRPNIGPETRTQDVSNMINPMSQWFPSPRVNDEEVVLALSLSCAILMAS